MPVHNLIIACSPFAGPCLAPFAFFFRVLLCLTFGTMRTLLRPCGHVWGLTMRKCAPCGLERACSFLTCSCFTGIAPRCSQCLLELCSAITFKCRIGSSLSVCSAGEWFCVLCLVGLFGGLSRCVFGFFSLFCSFHQHLFLSVSPVSLSMIV